jgi:hypothetical protein
VRAILNANQIPGCGPVGYCEHATFGQLCEPTDPE